jgi:hypothetical protein
LCATNTHPASRSAISLAICPNVGAAATIALVIPVIAWTPFGMLR